MPLVLRRATAYGRWWQPITAGSRVLGTCGPLPKGGGRLLRRKALVGLFSILALTVGGAQLARAAQDKVTICHKPGTPAEKTKEVPAQAVASHIGHGDTMGPCGAPTTTTSSTTTSSTTTSSTTTSSTTTTTMRPTSCAAAVSDLCIDGDGFATPLPGAFEVQIGDVLSAFPDGPATQSGLDLFDRAPLGVLTQADDLHAEDPSVCPGALRNGVHDASDCDILDVNGDLMNGTPVTCDIEFGGCNAFLIKYQDKNGNGAYDPQLGEDLVRDTNNNGIFD